MFLTISVFAIILMCASFLIVQSGRMNLALYVLPVPLRQPLRTVVVWLATSTLSRFGWSRVPWSALGELSAIGAWSLWVGRSLLDFSPNSWPLGREFIMATQSHIVWTWLEQCGTCILWNGTVNGGNPAFVELHGAVTHPLVIVTTLIWGYIEGAKVALVACLFIAGLAQWWLSHILRLSRAVRLWSAALAVVGGHLAGRLEIGVFGVILSTACGSLAIVAGIALALDGRRRSAVLFGITLALTIMAGQGYIQLGILLMLPAFTILLFDHTLQFRSVWREFVVAGLLAGLLSAIFLVPLEYMLLNLVVRDVDFYHSTFLQKQPYPYLYINYIGWFPILVALAAVRRMPSRLMLFFLTSISLIYLTSSAIPFKLLLLVVPSFAASVRNPSLIAGLAVPLIIGLASLGLHTILISPWPKLMLRTAEGISPSFNITWLALILAFWSIKPVYEFGQQWLTVAKPPDSTSVATSYLAASELRWVEVPLGEGNWLPAAFEAQLKLNKVTRPWNWADRTFPVAAQSIVRDSENGAPGAFVAALDGISVSQPVADVMYAVVQQNGTLVPCVAHGLGGSIDVRCETTEPGSLVV